MSAVMEAGSSDNPLCPFSGLPAALIQHIVSFVVGEDALVFFGRARDPCTVCSKHRGSHSLTINEPLHPVVIGQRSALRLVSRDVSTATGSLIRGLEVPLAALLEEEEADLSVSTLDLSMLNELVLVGLNVADVATTMGRVSKETLMQRLHTFLGAALWSGHNVSLVLRSLGVATQEDETQGKRCGAKAFRDLWGAFSLDCVPASVEEGGGLGWLRLHRVDLWGAEELEDRDVHALLLTCHDLEHLALARCYGLRRPLMPMVCPEFVPHLRCISVDGAWRLAVDELLAVRRLRPHLSIDMVDDELNDKEVEVVIIQEGSPHQGQWVRCRLLSRVEEEEEEEEARFGRLGEGGGCAYARFDVFVHETRRFDHAVGFSSKVAHGIERKYLRHLCSQRVAP